MSLIRNAFRRLHYPVDIIAQCVRWYLAYALSLRNLEEMMTERGIVVDHSTLHRWVIHLVPLLDEVFRRHKRTVGRRWRMDETYIRIKGQWKYLYRAVDTDGQSIDFLLTARRDAAAALRFFRKAIRNHGEPEVVTIDKIGANTAALATLNADNPEEEAITIRQRKYLNNLIEQHIEAGISLCDAVNFLVEKYALVRTDQPGFSACTRSQLINSIDILRARRATGLMTRDNYRTVNNITQGKHPEAKQ